LKDIGNPVAVCLAHDPNAPAIFQAGDIVLLEVFTSGEQDLRAGDYYAVEEEGCGLLRQYARQDSAWFRVRGRAIWVGRDLRARRSGAPVG
jgi:hypothetical protein